MRLRGHCSELRAACGGWGAAGRCKRGDRGAGWQSGAGSGGGRRWAVGGAAWSSGGQDFTRLPPHRPRPTTPAQAAADAAFAGVLAAYVSYDVAHWAMHSGRLRGPLRARHMHHHFADGGTAYGISSPLWDAVFRTQPRLGAAGGGAAGGAKAA